MNKHTTIIISRQNISQLHEKVYLRDNYVHIVAWTYKAGNILIFVYHYLKAAEELQLLENFVGSYL